MRTLIHVNQHVIKRNRKTGEREAPITVKTWKSNQYAHEVVIKDAAGQEVARVLYRPDAPLSCGATVWVESECEVEVIG